MRRLSYRFRRCHWRGQGLRKRKPCDLASGEMGRAVAKPSVAPSMKWMSKGPRTRLPAVSVVVFDDYGAARCDSAGSAAHGREVAWEICTGPMSGVSA